MSKKKLEQDAEDKEIFRNMIKDVKPIEQDKYISPPQSTKPRIHARIIF